MDPDLTAPKGAVGSGSTLFAKMINIWLATKNVLFHF